MRRAAIALVLLVTSFAHAHADESWSTVSTKNGVTLEKREVPGSKFHQYRATVDIEVAPAAAAKALWTAITQTVPATIKKREVLKKTDDEIVVYDQIHTPVVSDRDVVMRIRRSPSGGGVEITFQSATDIGPASMAGFVRLPVVRGRWSLQPTGSGSHIVYECYSEPGGSVPAFLVRGTQQSEVSHDVERMVALMRGGR